MDQPIHVFHYHNNACPVDIITHKLDIIVADT